MAKLENYNGTIKIIDGLNPFGEDYPLMDAHYVQTGEDGKRLDAELEAMKADVEKLKKHHLEYEWVDVNSIIDSAFSSEETFEEGVLPYIQDAAKFRIEVNSHDKNMYGESEHGENWETWQNLQYECIFIPVAISSSIRGDITEITLKSEGAEKIEATECVLDIDLYYYDEYPEDNEKWASFATAITLTIDGVEETNRSQPVIQQNASDSYEDMQIYAYVPVQESATYDMRKESKFRQLEALIEEARARREAERASRKETT